MEDFILGLGKVSVKGQILSAPNNQAIENATIFSLYDPQYDNFYSGNDASLFSPFKISVLAIANEPKDSHQKHHEEK